MLVRLELKYRVLFDHGGGQGNESGGDLGKDLGRMGWLHEADDLENVVESEDPEVEWLISGVGVGYYEADDLENFVESEDPEVE